MAVFIFFCYTGMFSNVHVCVPMFIWICIPYVMCVCMWVCARVCPCAWVFLSNLLCVCVCVCVFYVILLRKYCCAVATRHCFCCIFGVESALMFVVRRPASKKRKQMATFSSGSDWVMCGVPHSNRYTKCIWIGANHFEHVLQYNTWPLKGSAYISVVYQMTCLRCDWF